MTNWTDKEIKLFFIGYSDEEIAKRTGRTVRAVENKRRRIINVESVEYDPITYNPYKDLTREQKITRIHDLADKLKVKIAR